MVSTLLQHNRKNPGANLKTEMIQVDFLFPELDVRRKNILASPKFAGSSEIDSRPFLKELAVEIIERKQPIQFTRNFSEHVHRWAPYIQGFSAEFVQSVLDQYEDSYQNPLILDPFAGCGTVLVQAKFNGYRSFGTELSPLLHFIANVKLDSWDVSPQQLIDLHLEMPGNIRSLAPEFLESGSQFNKGVLNNLELIKGGINSLKPRSEQTRKAKDLFLVAFSSILIDCSKLKRTPCLGYSRRKRVEENAPWALFDHKVRTIANDLKVLQSAYKDYLNVDGNVVCANAMTYEHAKRFDLAITSPPYMNGMDYVMNYKIEMGWLGFVDSHRAAKKIKDDMVVCDNVSKGLVKEFAGGDSVYTNDWIEAIKTKIGKNIERRGSYRRQDMPFIVHKYFDTCTK